MLYKTRLSVFAILILFLSLTAICAEDNSTFDEITAIDNNMDELNSIETNFEEIAATDNNPDETNSIKTNITEITETENELNLQTDDCDEVLSLEAGNFTELSDLINSGNTTIDLNKDYKYDSGDSGLSNGITINKPITINGNGHTIDASNSARIFTITSSNVILNNITFINGYSSTYGGAINTNNTININNCNFDNNNARFGGAVYSSSKITIDNCNFTNNEVVRTGGSLYLGGSNSIVNNSNFENNTANEFNGGAMSIYGSNTIVDNCNFSNSYCYNCGGALAWSGTKGTVKNSNFHKGDAGSGGSIFFFSGATYATVDRCTFSNDYGATWAGSVYFYASYGTLTNSKFYNNYAGTAGGAVYSDDYRMIINNCLFEGNNAHLGGGALTIFGGTATVTNSIFNSNTADSHGGSIYAGTYNSKFDNLTVTNSYAASGGGMYFVYSEKNTNLNSNSQLTNSRFINNTARYGGGALTVTDHTTVRNSNFTGNSAGSYGGSIDTTFSTLSDLIIENSSSFYGGAIYTYDSSIINVQLINNHANVGNDIYVLNKSSIVNTDVLDENIVYYGNDTRGSVIGTSETQHQITKLMETSSGYYAFCAERYNLSPYTGIHDLSMEKLKNSINYQPVADYLKILIYNYVDHIDDLRLNDFHDYVWAFTDYEYWNSTDPVVMEVIRLYDSGFRVPTENACKVLANGTLMYFNFSSLITPSGQQNLFLFKFEHGSEINETLDKEVLNKTAIVGDNIEFRIIITNKGNQTVYDNFIEDKDYSNGLVYQNWRSEVGDWTFDNLTGQWKLSSLEAGKSASIILIFKVLVNGTLYNNATSGVGNVNVTNSTDYIRVYNPNMTVNKITLNKTVVIGSQVRFQISVKNNGDMNLTNVSVTEYSYEGLIYDSYDETDLWMFSIVGEKPTWKLNQIFKPGEVLNITVIFNTTARGNFTNVVMVSSNETGNRTGNNTTQVLKPDLKVEKIVLTPSVVVGNEAIFEIIVKNTGEVDLENVFVRESKYDSGLVYLRYSSAQGSWTHSLDNDGKHVFALNGLLKVGESARFRVVFNTTKLGNFTNFAEAGYGNTTVSNSTNMTEVINKTTPQNSTNHTTDKTTTNKTTNKLTNETPNNTTTKINPPKNNETSTTNKTTKKHAIFTKTENDKKVTGNPILALLLALILIPLRRFKN